VTDGSGGGGFASIVGATLSSYAEGSKTLELPVGTLPGDQLVAVFFQNTSDGTWTPPAGFTYGADLKSNPPINRILYWTGIAGSVGDPLTFELSNERAIQGVLVAIRDGLVGDAFWTTGDYVTDQTLAMPGLALQFAVQTNWDGMPHGTPPASWSDVATASGVSAVGTLTGTSAVWTGINDNVDPALGIAFGIIPA
jgi:hypothetical protein